MTAVIVIVEIRVNCSRRAPGYFILIGDTAPPAARNSSEVARRLSQRSIPLTPETAGRVCI